MVATPGSITVDALTAMTQQELDDAFGHAPLGELPDGDAIGAAVVAPGTEAEGIVQRLGYWLAWQGKVVYRSRGYLVNKVGPFGFHLFKARVYVAPSWFDGEPAIILDYSKTSLLAHQVRDEIREVSPGLYLGIVFYAGAKTINFILDFTAKGHQRA